MADVNVLEIIFRHNKSDTKRNPNVSYYKCECGQTVQYRSLTRHWKSKKHKTNLLNLQDSVPLPTVHVQ